MFSNVRKYSKNFIQKVRNSNDQNLSSFGTIQTPFPLWKYEEVSNTCSIFCRTAQFYCIENWCNSLELSILQCIGCLPSTKSTLHHDLLLLQLHNLSTFVRWMCAYGRPPSCTIVHCTIVQSTHMCVTLNCATWNAQCAGGDFVQCVIKNLTVLSQNLDDPYYLCISMCSCRCANVCTCSDSCTMEAVLGKIKSGRGDFPIRCLVFYDPKILQNRRN